MTIPQHHRFIDLEHLAATEEFLTFVDADLHILDINPSQPGLGEIIGTSVLDWVEPRFHAEVRRAVDEALTSGCPQHFNSEAVGPMGAATRYSNWVLRQRFEDEPDCVAILGLDLGHLDRTTAAARIAQSTLEAIAGSSPDFITVIDREYRVQLVNRVAPGLSADEVVGTRLTRFWSADRRHEITQLIDGVFESGQPASYEQTVELPEGTYRFATHVSPVREQGPIERVTLVSRDVTGEAGVLDELRRSEERYRQLVEHSPTAIVVLDVDHNKFVAANNAAADLFGLTAEEIIKYGPAELSPPQQPDGRPSVAAAQRQVEAALRGERPRFEWIHHHADGHEVHCDILLTLLPNERRSLVQGTIADLTLFKTAQAEREQLAAELQHATRMEAIGQLTGGVAHDFNNLLTVVQGNLELIRMAPGDAEETTELATAAIEASERASALTQRLLAFSRRQQLQPRSVDCNHLVSGMEDLLRRSLGETIEIDTRLSEGLWSCEVDPTQLENAVLNLAINARDAMPRSGRLTIETANVRLAEDSGPEQVPAGDYVVLKVADTGTGIAPELMELIVEPFFTTKGVGKGSGLGLSMVYGFAQQSGGRLRISSELGDGTSVELYLPRAGADPESIPKRDRKTVPRGRGEPVLVVEDDLHLRQLSVTFLTRLGYSPLQAGTGREALELLDEHPEVDTLFTDVVLPGGMTGTELATKARQLRPQLRVLFASGYAESAILDQSQTGAGVDLLEKPFSYGQLARRIRSVIDA